LYYVKGTNPTNTKTTQVECVASCLNSNHCFVLITPKKAYAWYGKFAHGDERNVAKLVAETLMSPSQVEVVFESKEKDDFWNFFTGGKQEYTTKQAEAIPDFEPRLFQCSNVTGNLEVEEIFNFSQEDLISEDVMILDSWNEVYVWIGGHVNPEEKKQALDTAIKYLNFNASSQSVRNPTSTPILTIKQGFEPPLFTSHFIWDNEKAHAGINDYEKLKKEMESGGNLVADASKELAKFSKTYSLEILLKRPLPEGVDPARLENHLDFKDFPKAFGCTHDEYLALPKWKRDAKKKESRLF